MRKTLKDRARTNDRSGKRADGRGDNAKEYQTEYDGSAHTNPFWYCVHVGFFAGLIWGATRWLLYLIHFTNVLPGFLADPFFRQSFLKTGWGHLTGLGFFIVFSILAALVYKVVLGRIKGPWPGVLYGLFWWLALFVMAGPAMGLFPQMSKIGYDTIFSECALYLVWGLFIGYTLAFEYTDEASREPMGAH